jgi:hypothetical protein
MRTAGYWASRSNIRWNQADRYPSNYYVAWLAILENERGRENVTPYYFVSEDLCALAPFLSLASQVPPSLHGFRSKPFRYNHAAALLNRFAHWIVTCYQCNFNDSFIQGLDTYVAKVIYLQGMPSPKVLALLKQYRIPPILLCDQAEGKDACLAAGLHAEVFTRVKVPELMDQIGALFKIPLATLEAMGFTPEETLFAHFLAEDPALFTFGESGLNPVPCTGYAFLEPNETLLNVLRRRINTANQTRPPRENSVHLIVDTTVTTFAHLVTDALLCQYEREPSKGIASDILGPIAQYAATPTAEAYDAIVSAVRDGIHRFPTAHSIVLCCPAVNRKSIEGLFLKTIPNRVLKHLFRKKGNDYLTFVSPSDFHSEVDWMMFLVLMEYAAQENFYLSAALTLYALADRRPVIRTPQLSSHLYGRLRVIRQAHGSGKATSVNRLISGFSVALAADLPAEVITFLAQNRGPHIKLVSDLPVEWLALNGVPLVYQHNVSRMPLRPANGLLIHFDECRSSLRLDRRDVENVLVLDCTNEGDPIGRHAGILHEQLLRMGFKSALRRPCNVEEYKNALNESSPCILVHWGHGSYDSVNDRGYIFIRNERAEVWDWEGTTIPPIIILGACETSALAQTQNNPANAWLALGARSVLATLLPVQADLTCLLLTRIFANLDEAVSGEQVMADWSVVVSKTIILQRYLDFFYGYQRYRAKRRLREVPPQFYLEYTYQWNRRTKSLVDGYQRCLEIMRHALASFDAEFANSFDRYLALGATMPHTMFFTHLGSPETIKLGKKPIQKESEAREYWKRRDSGQPAG